MSAYFDWIPTNQIGHSSPIVVKVSFATSKLAMPPIGHFLRAKYLIGSDKTISIPNAWLRSANAILNP